MTNNFSVEERIKFHMLLSNLADQLYANFNPCEAIGKRCSHGRKCCGSCTYSDDGYCTADCLMCKIWLCRDAAKKANGQFLFQLESIYNQTKMCGFDILRASLFDCISESALYVVTEIILPWNRYVKIRVLKKNIITADETLI